MLMPSVNIPELSWGVLRGQEPGVFEGEDGFALWDPPEGLD